MQGDRIMSALVGLTGAISNNSKTENTDQVVIQAICSMAADSREEEEAALEAVHKEKFIISPNCATCKSPCGNTSDYDLDKFYGAPDKLRELKEELVVRLINVAKKLNEGDNSSCVPDLVFRAITYFGYDMAEESYYKLFQDLEEV